MLRGTDSGNCCNVELSPVISLNSDLQRIIAKSCIYICTIPLALSLSDSEEWTKSQWFSCGEHITHVCVCVCVCVRLCPVLGGYPVCSVKSRGSGSGSCEGFLLSVFVICVIQQQMTKSIKIPKKTCAFKSNNFSLLRV